MGTAIRQSLDTASWESATDRIREWEAKGYITDREMAIPTIADACDQFLAEKAAENISPNTIRVYRNVCAKLKQYCRDAGVATPRGITLRDLQECRRAWKVGPLTSRVHSAVLVMVVRFFGNHEWADPKILTGFKLPKYIHKPTLPYSPEEVDRMLAACQTMPAKPETRQRAEALIYLLRYSGLRLGDAMKLGEGKVTKDGMIFLYQQKTTFPVYVPVPPVVVERLNAVKLRDGQFFVPLRTLRDSRNMAYTTKGRDWLDRAAAEAKVTGAKPHRFRDTFAVEFLNAGVPLETVSVLLGHSSIDITEKHYAPWVKSRQSQLEAVVRAAHKQDSRLNGNHTHDTRDKNSETGTGRESTG